MKHRSIRVRRSALAAAALAVAVPAAQAVSFQWSSGNFVAGVTAPSPLSAGDVLDIEAGGNKFFSGAASNFDNGGTVNWNADNLFLQSGAVVSNHALWNANGDTALVYNGGAAPAFINHGVFRKSAGTGSTTIGDGVGFVNHGTLDAVTGTLRFVGGSVFNAGSVFTGAGVVEAASGTNTFSGAFTSSNLRLTGGTHLGNGAVVGGVAAWTGGNLAGGWTVGSGQTFAGVAGGSKIINGALLVNQGTLAWDTTDALYLQSGAVLRNEALFEARQTMTVTYNGGTATQLENTATGTVRAAAGHTLTMGNGAGFINQGGLLEAATGASIRYAGGSVFNDGTRFGGAGSNLAVGNNRFNGGLTSANLELQAGVHQGGNAVISGAVAWAGGTIGGTWAVAAGQTLNGNAGGSKILSDAGTVLVNEGNIRWNTGDALYLQSGAVLQNKGLFLAGQSSTLLYNGGAATVFDNTASGTVRVAAGQTLTIGNGVGFTNHGGLLDAEAGARIVYSGGASFNAGTRFAGAGSNAAAGSNLFSGRFESANLVLQNGVHSGSGAVVGGTAQWAGGNLAGGWAVAAGQTLRAAGGGSKILEGAGTQLVNHGGIDWGTGDALFLQSGATLQNKGLFVAAESMSVVYNGGAATLFDNTAAGTVRAAAGRTLTFGNGSGLVNHGQLDAEAGASIVYAGGAQFNAGTRFTGAGRNVAAGSNRFEGRFESANLLLQSGVHAGNGAVVGGSAAWSGGDLGGSWKVDAGQVLRGTDGGSKIINGAASVLINQGTLAWDTGNAMFLQSGATLNNQGRLDFSADGSVIYNGGSAPSFVNSGLIVKSGGSGSTVIGNSLGFDNQGVIEVQTGTIVLPSSFGNRGTLAGLGSYSVAGTLTNAGSVAPGGAASATGTLTLAGSYLQTAAGSFAVDLQSLASHDLFNIGGTALLGGTLALSCHGGCSLAVGDVLTILDSAGDLGGSFANVTLSGFGSGAFSVVYDTVADRVLLQVTQTVTAVPEPGTWAMLLAGLGLLAFRRRQNEG